MHGELINIPTDSLIDMLFVILTGELAVTANDVTEIEQIQRELQRRGEDKYWELLHGQLREAFVRLLRRQMPAVRKVSEQRRR
jgi:hypothetical protein